MTPIADKSGILDLDSLEQFITIEDLKTEALDENWSIGNESQPNYPDKVIIIGGKRWFEILVAVVQTVIKTRTLEPIRFGYQPASLGAFSWNEKDIYKIALVLYKKRFLGKSLTHKGILSKLAADATIQDVIRLMLSQAPLWISSLGDKSINYNSVEIIRKVLWDSFEFELEDIVGKSHPDFERLVIELVEILTQVNQQWPKVDGLNSKGLPAQQLPAVFRRTKEMTDACKKISQLSPTISKGVLFEALERVLPPRRGTFEWMRKNPREDDNFEPISNFRSSESRDLDSVSLLNAARELQEMLTDEGKLVVLAIAHEKAGEVLPQNKLLALGGLFDVENMRETIGKCSDIVSEVCSTFNITDEDLHEYLFNNNFPTPSEPI
jgi:hypothetical protein